MEPCHRPEGIWLRFGGGGAEREKTESGVVLSLQPGERLSLGIARYTFFKGNWETGYAAFRQYMRQLGHGLPILVQVPLKLGATRCWWSALAFDLLNLSRPEGPTVALDWITDDRLTLSIDLRKMPPTPGVLYGWGIVLWFDPPDPDGRPERALARRKSWSQPMKLSFSHGTSVAYDRHGDHPAAGLFLKEGFHKGYGAYFMKADPHGCIEAHLDPDGNLYEQPVFWIEGIDPPQIPEVIWNRKTLSPDGEFSYQPLREGGCLIRLAFSIDRPGECRIALG